jgi:hypothetical protein
MATLGPFYPKKFPFYIPMAALFLFFGRQLTKFGYQKKALTFGSHSTHRRRSWDVEGIYAFDVSGEHPKRDVIH